MKKKACLLAAVLFIMLSVPAYAVQERQPMVFPSIAFDTSRATFSVTVDAENNADEISVAVEVWEDDTLKTSWSEEGSGALTTAKTVSAVRGRSYTLKAYATINGRELPVASTFKRCPWYT